MTTQPVDADPDDGTAGRQLRFDGRTAVVTGGGRGVGRAHCLELAARGARVVVNDIGAELDGARGTESPADDVVSEIRGAGGEAEAAVFDIATAEGGRATVDLAVQTFGGIDIVIHNAGVGSTASLDTQYGIHLLAAFHVIEAAWPHLVRQQYGRILLTSSSAALWSNVTTPSEFAPGPFAYGALKAAQIGLMHNLAVAGTPHQINVNAIAPYSRTRMSDRLSTITNEVGEVTSTLMARAEPEQIAVLAAWLLHEECDVTHEIFSVGAGRFARVFLGEVTGLISPKATPESLRESWEAVENREGYRSFTHGLDEMRAWVDMVTSHE